jgi:hypothetical protein
MEWSGAHTSHVAVLFSTQVYFAIQICLLGAHVLFHKLDPRSTDPHTMILHENTLNEQKLSTPQFFP